MQVKVVNKPDELDCECIVVQSNKAPLPPSDSDSCAELINENEISVVVPFRTSSAVCQVNYDQRKKLEECYYNCILLSNKHNFKSIMFPSLGTEDLYWDPVQSASAAREAMLSLFSDLPDEFMVVFYIEDEEDFEIWNGVMRF